MCIKWSESKGSLDEECEGQEEETEYSCTTWMTSRCSASERNWSRWRWAQIWTASTVRGWQGSSAWEDRSRVRWRSSHTRTSICDAGRGSTGSAVAVNNKASAITHIDRVDISNNHFVLLIAELRGVATGLATGHTVGAGESGAISGAGGIGEAIKIGAIGSSACIREGEVLCRAARREFARNRSHPVTNEM